MTAISGNTVANTVGVFDKISTTCMPDILHDHVPQRADEPDNLYYFDASDSEKIILGHAVHLNIKELYPILARIRCRCTFDQTN